MIAHCLQGTPKTEPTPKTFDAVIQSNSLPQRSQLASFEVRLRPADSVQKDLSVPPPLPLSEHVRQYLETKGSPLADDSEFLVTQKHWRLLIAISAIESQYCKRLISFNCWGIGGDTAYRHYGSFPEAIADANNLIEKWQARGRWLTPEDMNCSYVVPCSPNWLIVVKRVLKEVESIK